ncbi:MAG: FtsX-like permease family protein [Myxococcota bacterium]
MIARLALRNLVRNRVRTAIAASATIIGLVLALFATSLETGQWNTMLKASISTAAGHVVVQGEGYLADPDPRRHVAEASRVISDVESLVPAGSTVLPRVQLGGLLTSPKNSVAIGVRGVDPERERPFTRIDDLFGPEGGAEGAWLGPDDDRGILVGRVLADKLGVGLEDKVVFLGQGTGEDIDSRLFRVRGIFETGNDFVDGFSGFVTLAAGQALLGAGDAVTQLAVQLPASGAEESLQQRVVQRLEGSPVEVLTWREVLPLLDEQRELDEGFSLIIYSLLIGAVAIGIVIVVFMSVLERTREFGVLMAIGMKPRILARMVLLEGALLGVLSTLAGIALAILLIVGLNAFGGIDLGSLVANAVPVEGVTIDPVLRPGIDPFKFVFFGAATVTFSVVSTLWPAWRVLQMRPVQAMNAG